MKSVIPVILFFFGLSCQQSNLSKGHKTPQSLAKAVFQNCIDHNQEAFFDDCAATPDFVRAYHSHYTNGTVFIPNFEQGLRAMEENKDDLFSRMTRYRLHNGRNLGPSWEGAQIDSISTELITLKDKMDRGNTERIEYDESHPDHAHQIHEGEMLVYFTRNDGDKCFLTFKKIAKIGDGPWKVMNYVKCSC